MLIPISNPCRGIVTRLALTLFSREAYKLGANVSLGLITRGEAVRILKKRPTYNQLVQDCGLEVAQQIMADGLSLRGTP